jgi:hypothetical protein
MGSPATASSCPRGDSDTESGGLVTNVSPAANERLIMTGSGRSAARLIVHVRWLRPAAPIGGSLVLRAKQGRPRCTGRASRYARPVLRLLRSRQPFPA